MMNKFLWEKELIKIKRLVINSCYSFISFSLSYWDHCHCPTVPNLFFLASSQEFI